MEKTKNKEKDEKTHELKDKKKKLHEEKCECYKDDCNCDESKCNCNEECHCEENILKIKELEEALLRLKADNINYRKRKDEEVSKMLKFASEDMVKDILPIVDNFERAIKLDDNDLTDELSKFLAGFKMIYCHLVETLEKYEVKAIDGINKEFDPNFHQGVLTEKVEGVNPGMVVEVMQKGYMFKDKVIRPAMVKVSE